MRNLYYLGWDPHQYRVFGSFLDVFVAATIFGLILIYFLTNFSKISLNKNVKTVLISAYTLLGLFTYSRGFYVSILLAVIAYLIINKKVKYILFLLLFSIISISILPKPFGEGVNLKRTFSIEARLDDNKKALEIFNKKPILGIGYNHMKDIKKEFSIFPNHGASSFSSSFLTILATSGIVGLVAFLLAIWNLGGLKGGKYYVLFISTFSLFDNVFLHPFVLFFVFLSFDS